MKRRSDFVTLKHIHKRSNNASFCIVRQRGHHAAQSPEGEGGEGHASEDGSAAGQPGVTAAGAQRTPPTRTRQQRGREGHAAATGEDEEARQGAYVAS